MAELGRRLEALEKPKAESRKGKRTDLEPAGNFPAGSSGEVRDKVGAALGVSGKTYEAAKSVVENGVPTQRTGHSALRRSTSRRKTFSHCFRGAGTHVRGCWVVDGVLSKG